ncbi:hypothetical protein BT69DRAFT_1357087 [Atractiella rhizophila]|nr:hypothetical protein BT69DRAFT_1357087 [Atractiella rhizophila]
MSLYGGISFAGSKAVAVPEPPAQAAQSARSTLEGALGKNDLEEVAKERVRDLSEKGHREAGKEEVKGAEEAKEKEGHGGEEKKGEKVWSSSLRFAPIKRKQPSTTVQVPKSGMSTAAVIAASTSNLDSNPPPQPLAQTSLPAGMTVKKIVPPPLTLPGEEEDVNGFLKTDAGRRAQKSTSKKKKKKKGGKVNEPEPVSYDAEYDPAKPNDYFEWLEYQRQKREERQMERQREKERKRRRSSESDYSSDYSDRSRSNSPRETKRAKVGMFAPPKNYDSPPPQPEASFAPPPEETGEAAYARRVAMAPMNETGEDAYARRLAMSKALPPPPPPSYPPPELMPGTVYRGPELHFQRQMAPKPAEPFDDGGIPPAPLASELSPPLPVAAPAFNLSEAQQKAKAIAEKLSKLGAQPPQPAPPPPPAPEENDGPKDFASRFMAKYGWSEGQGLGAVGREGRVDALSIAQPTKEKKGKGKNKAEPAPTPKVGLRGNVVDTARDQKRAEEKDKYGEPSRIVLLSNMVEPDQIDDDLPGEIAEEAGKHGIVERCFIYTLPTYGNVEDAVRVFVVFSGMAGAYMSLKQFDGRFFGGRVVKARFYSEKDFFSARYDR